MTTHTEQIECPECNHKQVAIVYHTFPWNSYVHDCIKCGYTIMESEWDSICVISGVALPCETVQFEEI